MNPSMSCSTMSRRDIRAREKALAGAARTLSRCLGRIVLRGDRACASARIVLAKAASELTARSSVHLPRGARRGAPRRSGRASGGSGIRGSRLRKCSVPTPYDSMFFLLLLKKKEPKKKTYDEPRPRKRLLRGVFRLKWRIKKWKSSRDSCSCL